MNQNSFLAGLWRNALAALPLGILVFLLVPRQGGIGWDLFDGYSVAFCFTLFGWFTELVLLALPGIETGAGRLVRLVGWFAGGLWSSVIARWLWMHYGRDLNELPGLIAGGVAMIVLELLLHLGLRLAKRPNFYP